MSDYGREIAHDIMNNATNQHYLDYAKSWHIQILERVGGWMWRLYQGHRLIKWGAAPNESEAWRDAHREYKEATQPK